LEQICKTLGNLPNTFKFTNSVLRVIENMNLAIVQYLQSRMFILRLLPNVTMANAVKMKSEYVLMLEQQVLAVEQQIRDGTARRKFEDVKILKISLDELILERDSNE
jgi:hypothetical protein